MTQAPEWWYQLTGLASVAVIVAMFVTIILLFVVIQIALQIKRSILELTSKVQSIAGRVESVAKQVETVTTEVGARTTGIVRTVDDIAGSAFQVVERYAPIAIGAAVLFKLFSLSKKKKQ